MATLWRTFTKYCTKPFIETKNRYRKNRFLASRNSVSKSVNNLHRNHNEKDGHNRFRHSRSALFEIQKTVKVELRQNENEKTEKFVQCEITFSGFPNHNQTVDNVVKTITNHFSSLAILKGAYAILESMWYGSTGMDDICADYRFTLNAKSEKRQNVLEVECDRPLIKK